MAKEIKPGIGWNNVNGISKDDDRTCALNDMNCLETQEKKSTCVFYFFVVFKPFFFFQTEVFYSLFS